MGKKQGAMGKLGTLGGTEKLSLEELGRQVGYKCQTPRIHNAANQGILGKL